MNITVKTPTIFKTKPQKWEKLIDLIYLYEAISKKREQ